MNHNSTTTEQVWELLSARLRSFLLQRVSDEQLAEDLLQETFVRIHRKLDEVDDSHRLTAWVFQIARNLVVDHYRAQSRAAMDLADRLETEDDAVNLNEVVAGWLPPMIAQLPSKYREAVELYELEGVSQQEIAHRLGLSLSGAKSRVQRGREKLKAILFDCCSFEQDRRGNVIGFAKNALPESPPRCPPKCEESDECGT